MLGDFNPVGMTTVLTFMSSRSDWLRSDERGEVGTVIVKAARSEHSMGATVWQRDESGGKTFTVGGAPAATTGRTPQQPSQRPGKRKKLVWSRDDAAGTPGTSGHPAPPSAAPAPGAAADGAAQTAKRQRTATAAAADDRPAASAIPAQHTNGASNSSSGHAANGNATNDSQADDAAPVKPSVKVPLGAGLARQLRQNEAELERMRQEMYAKQRRLHEEHVSCSVSSVLKCPLSPCLRRDVTDAWSKSLLPGINEQLHPGNEDVLASASKYSQTSLRGSMRAVLPHAPGPSHGFVLHLRTGCRACRVIQWIVPVSISRFHNCGAACRRQSGGRRRRSSDG